MPVQWHTQSSPFPIRMTALLCSKDRTMHVPENLHMSTTFGTLFLKMKYVHTCMHMHVYTHTHSAFLLLLSSTPH